jgi:hypothetical protein
MDLGIPGIVAGGTSIGHYDSSAVSKKHWRWVENIVWNLTRLRKRMRGHSQYFRMAMKIEHRLKGHRRQHHSQMVQRRSSGDIVRGELEVK